MLKIKDNVDLKELEKYGFKEEYGFYEKEIENGDGNLLRWYVNKGYKTIEVSTYDGCEFLLDNTLYDLIQDGLVVKYE